ncbi:MAG: hypothetical protein R3B93_05945 [Bacteroidia bacterium]
MSREDNQAPGGFVHGGHFILIDYPKANQGYYDGTKEDEVNQLMEDVTFLLDGKKELGLKTIILFSWPVLLILGLLIWRFSSKG